MSCLFGQILKKKNENVNLLLFNLVVSMFCIHFEFTLNGLNNLFCLVFTEGDFRQVDSKWSKLIFFFYLLAQRFEYSV